MNVARIRSIKPEIRRSLVVSSWKYDVRWTFVGLPGYLDDDGRGHDDTRLIKAELYPLDDDMTAKKLDKHLALIAETGPLCRYTVAGKPYLHITTWSEHQRVNRPTPSRIPPCPVHEQHVSTHGGLTEPSPPHVRARTQARAAAEQGREQGREQGAGSVEASGELVVVSGQPQPTPAEPGTLTQPTATLDLLEQTGPWVAKVRGQLAPQVDEMLTAGTDPSAIRRGLEVLRTRRGAPGLLPFLVQDELTPAAAADPRFAGLIADARAHGAVG